MGGTGAMTFAAMHPELIDAMASANGAANLLEYDVDGGHKLRDAIKDSFGGRKDETPAEYKKRNPAEYIRRSAEFHPEQFTMPVAFTLGGKDTLVPPQSTLRLVKAIQKHNRHVLLIYHEDGGHQTSYADTVDSMKFVIDAMHSSPSPTLTSK
jgi:dipeptidyl aminopeptidase/acylaminoacyl peptidase